MSERGSAGIGRRDSHAAPIDGLLASRTIDRPGHLWGIIGRRTFSAAQNTVNLIRSFAQPIFVGEPTGSRPRFVGESTWFVLPHSRTRVVSAPAARESRHSEASQIPALATDALRARG